MHGFLKGFRNISLIFLVVKLYLVIAKEKLNVVFIIFDDLRPAIGAYGDHLAITPNLDKFAATSYVFTRAYSQVSMK